MNIFTTTVSFKIEDIHCYYLCEHTHKVFKEKMDGAHNLLISKNTKGNDDNFV